MKASLLFTFILFFLCGELTAQTYPADKIVGTWVRCTSRNLNLEFECGSDTTLIYTFNSDGTFYNNQVWTMYGETHPYTGIWTYSELILMTDVTNEVGFQSPSHEESIIWINSDLFYSIGCEGRKCQAIVYVYYQRVN